MPDLTAFLQARISEDEKLARETAADEHLLRSLRSIVSAAPLPGAEISHIVRWSPARVLAECDSKRRIVERQQHAASAQSQGVINSASIAVEIAWTDALRILAQPYADHPDFDSSWRVE